MDFEGSRGSVRGRFEAVEARRRSDFLERLERMEASAVRDRLERGAPVQRQNRVGALAAMVAIDGLSSRSLPDVLGELRRSAQGPLRKAAVTKVPDAEGGVNSDAQTRANLTIEEFSRMVARQVIRNRYF